MSDMSSWNVCILPKDWPFVKSLWFPQRSIWVIDDGSGCAPLGDLGVAYATCLHQDFLCECQSSSTAALLFQEVFWKLPLKVLTTAYAGSAGIPAVAQSQLPLRAAAAGKSCAGDCQEHR